MNVQITKRDGALIVGAAVLISMIAFICQLIYPAASILVLQVASTIVIVFVSLELYRRINNEILNKHHESEQQRLNEYRQIESAFSLFSTIKPPLPLPAMRGWAASPDFLKTVTEIVLRDKPGLVLEASSGVSTLIIAYCLKKLGQGKVISLEHDSQYATLTRELVSFHGLDDTATILYAPLVSVEIKGKPWLWYDTESLVLEAPVDLLVIDGPPGTVQPLSRYPALPILHEKLAPNWTIVIDDGLRDDEQEIVTMWLTEFSDVEAKFLELEKGAFVLRNKS